MITNSESITFNVKSIAEAALLGALLDAARRLNAATSLPVHACAN